MPDTHSSDSRNLFDPGPLPTGPPRMFAPVMAGDIQTAAGYLSSALVRMESVESRGEHFNSYESHRIDRALQDILRDVEALQSALTKHRQQYLDTA